MGDVFGSLSDDLRRTVLGYAKENEEFAAFLGYGVGWAFGSLSDDLRRMALEIAKENARFAAHLGYGVGRA
ncbi:MAG: hypothetical protein ACP5UD_08945, partial [Conexivisphaera sp.]